MTVRNGSLVIGVDASRALRPRRTGTERYAWEILHHLLRLPAAAVHCWRLYLDASPDPQTTAMLMPPGVQVELCVLPARRLWTHRTLAHELHRRPPDLLFVPSHVAPWAWSPDRLPPTVVTIHDLGYLYFPETHTRSQRLYLEWSTRWSATVATALIAVSQGTARDLHNRYGVPSGKIRVVHEAAAPLIHPAQDEITAVRARYGLVRPYALYVGTIQPRKNLARLITAYEQLCASHEVAWDLVLAGGEGWLSAPILAQARQSPYTAHIHLPGYVPDAELPALLAGACFFCLPSLYEGFGLPVLEAQQLGVPVIASDSSADSSAGNNSALPEIAGEAALLVDPTNVEAIAQAMLTLSQDEALRQRLIAAGYANVQRFSWEKAAEETLAVLVAAAGERAGTSGYEPDLRE
jgi:glycosyltransferase involved in cell wall biosynthesis